MATVIKAGEAGQVVRRLATVDLADHLREAQSVINDARSRAAVLIRDAQREVARMHDQMRAHAHGEGFAAGMAEGRAQGFETARSEALAAFRLQQDSLVSALSAAMAAFESMKTDLEIAARRDVLEFAVAVAVKLTFGVGALHREAAEENLRRALALVGLRTDVTVRVNPADCEALAQFAPQLVERLGGTKRVILEADEAVAPGGCRVHTPETDVDATLETQTSELVHLLLGEPRAPAAMEHAETPHV